MTDHIHPQTMIIPRSFTTKQQQLWVGQQLYGALPVYNTPYAFVILGELSVNHFQKAFQTLVNSCDVFRTIIK